MEGRVTTSAASARLGTIAPGYALSRLGYDARGVSVAGDLAPVEELVRNAKRVVFGELFYTRESGWAGPLAAYRRLLDLIPDKKERVAFSIADDHFADAEVGGFYRAALSECRAVAVVSQTLAQTVRALTSRPVLVCPEPVEGARGAPQAIAPRRVPAPLRWLARRAGLSSDSWRVRLLWFGYPQNLPPLLALLPQLETLARTYPLLLACVTSQPVPTTGEDSALRVQYIPWSPQIMDRAIAASDVILIPSDYRNPVKQAKSPNRLVAGLHGGRFVVAHPLPAYATYAEFAWIGEDLCEGLRWAIAHPREVVERIARGQAFIDERHSPDAVARFWLEVFAR